MIMQGVTAGVMTYGAWMAVLTLGVGAGWLARRILRPSIAEGQA